MSYIKLFAVVLVWLAFVINVLKGIKELLFKEKIIIQMRDLTDESEVAISHIPVAINNILALNEGEAAGYIKKELSNEAYQIDSDLKNIIIQYIKCFSSPDTNTVKSKLILLRTKLDIMLKSALRNKENTIKTRLPVNALLSLVFTIIII